jgi:hypothetical protein
MKFDHFPALNENEPKYSPVVKVLATDKDSNENQALTYMIISGNEDAQFEMNSGNGQISLVGTSLDIYRKTFLSSSKKIGKFRISSNVCICGTD